MKQERDFLSLRYTIPISTILATGWYPFVSGGINLTILSQLALLGTTAGTIFGRETPKWLRGGLVAGLYAEMYDMLINQYVPSDFAIFARIGGGVLIGGLSTYTFQLYSDTRRNHK